MIWSSRAQTAMKTIKKRARESTICDYDFEAFLCVCASVCVTNYSCLYAHMPDMRGCPLFRFPCSVFCFALLGEWFVPISVSLYTQPSLWVAGKRFQERQDVLRCAHHLWSSSWKRAASPLRLLGCGNRLLLWRQRCGLQVSKRINRLPENILNFTYIELLY